MTNSSERKSNLKSPESIISLIPIVISSGIAILLIIFYVIPQYVKSTKSNLELNALIKKKNELNNIKSQYKIINQKFDKLNNEKAIIIETISGTSNLDTLLEKLGELGERNSIEFDSIVPQKVINFVNNSSAENKKRKENIANLGIDPLLVEGIKKYLIDFSFKTNFINLLTFLRELEFQENIILLDDINLKLIDQNINNQNIDNSQEMIEVKLKITFYGKI
tara:strand:+ start:67 stop:732 length:666 start_codon:yes stop_codon:yes gene_type:complete